MVATAGPGWVLAPCLVALYAEADRLFPNRSVASDGTIGNDAHAATISDHNPDSSGDVLAADLTDDKANGCDADLLAQHLVASRDQRVRYVIWNDTIVKSYDSSRGPAWQPQPYDGENPHITHTHISVHDTAAAKNDVTAWFPQEDDVTPEQDARIRRIEQALDLLTPYPPAKYSRSTGRVDSDGTLADPSVGWAVETVIAARKTVARLAALESAVSQLGAGGSVDYQKVKDAAKAALREVVSGE